jgi:branched-chain amino acid transport system substrate-binding protein
MRSRPCVTAAVAALAFTVGACSSDGETTTPPTNTSATSAAPITGASTSSSEAPVETSADPAPDPSASPTEPAEPRGVLNIGFSEAILPGDPLAPIADAVQLQFDEWNEAGGVAGYQLELALNDGGMTPDAIGAAARDLVDEQGAVALFAAQNPTDCFTNRAYYESAGIGVIGMNAEACSDSPIAFPLSQEIGTTFPLIDSVLAARPGQRIAAIAVDVPGSRVELERLSTLAAARGATVELAEYVPFIGYDATATMVRVKQAEPDVVYLVLAPNDFATFATAAVQQGTQPSESLTWIGGVGAYADAVGVALGASGEGMLSVDITDDERPGGDEAAAMWSAAYPDVPFGQEAQAGFTLADVLRAGIESVDGEVTRESLRAALASLDSITARFLPDPLDYTESPRIAEQGIFTVTLRNGTWERDPTYLAPVG